MKVTKFCEWCNKSYCSRYKNTRFCSKSCASKNTRKKINENPVPQHIRDKISKSLTGRKLSPETIAKMILSKTGEKHWAWREPGHTFIHEATGYRKIKHNCEWVYEHRLVLEKKLGRKLNSHEITHHLDENKLNNSPDNLIIVSRAEHKMRYHPEIGKETRF